ncbi:MAG: DEAD/DEAH box helicase [Helicobacteraceae bacterium]
MNEFSELGLDESILQGLAQAGFKAPSPVQKEAIPLVLKGKDLIAQAHTGTGKTAAFGLPIMSLMQAKAGIETLIITPTRELAMQISDELYKLGKLKGVKTVTVYGGQSYSRQVKQIKSSANILVATPGRLLDLLQSGQIEIAPSFIVLDEADEMLDMGFLDDVEKILKHMPRDAQKLLFSATMPAPIRKIADKFLNEPAVVQITKEETTNKDISQEYYVVEEKEREAATIRLIDYYDPKRAIIFCRMKKEADFLANTLLAKGYPSKALHGDMEQASREQTISAFKRGLVEILVATDVAARGLDISNVSHVFNYHIPFDPQSYVHRIGRTGRAGKKGVAITLVTPIEFRELQKIKKIVGTNITHKFIPTCSDVYNDLSEKFASKILEQRISKEAEKMIDTLSLDLDAKELSYKLLSMLLEDIRVDGPDKIGLDMERINRLTNSLKDKEQKKERFKNRAQRRAPRSNKGAARTRSGAGSRARSDAGSNARSGARSSAGSNTGSNTGFAKKERGGGFKGAGKGRGRGGHK